MVSGVISCPTLFTTSLVCGTCISVTRSIWLGVHKREVSWLINWAGFEITQQWHLGWQNYTHFRGLDSRVKWIFITFFLLFLPVSLNYNYYGECGNISYIPVLCSWAFFLCYGFLCNWFWRDYCPPIFPSIWWFVSWSIFSFIGWFIFAISPLATHVIAVQPPYICSCVCMLLSLMIPVIG